MGPSTDPSKEELNILDALAGLTTERAPATAPSLKNDLLFIVPLFFVIQ
jgi:hypothetical protein